MKKITLVVFVMYAAFLNAQVTSTKKEILNMQEKPLWKWKSMKAMQKQGLNSGW